MIVGRITDDDWTKYVAQADWMRISSGLEKIEMGCCQSTEREIFNILLAVPSNPEKIAGGKIIVYHKLALKALRSLHHLVEDGCYETFPATKQVV